MLICFAFVLNFRISSSNKIVLKQVKPAKSDHRVNAALLVFLASPVLQAPKVLRATSVVRATVDRTASDSKARWVLLASKVLQALRASAPPAELVNAANQAKEVFQNNLIGLQYLLIYV